MMAPAVRPTTARMMAPFAVDPLSSPWTPPTAPPPVAPMAAPFSLRLRDAQAVDASAAATSVELRSVSRVIDSEMVLMLGSSILRDETGRFLRSEHAGHRQASAVLCKSDTRQLRARNV